METHRDHPSEASHLACGNLVARVAVEPGVKHLFDQRGLLELVGDSLGIIAVALHAHTQGLDAADR